MKGGGSIRHSDYGPSGKEASLRVYVHDTTSAPRMQSNSERMAGCAVAVHHNQLKNTYDSSKFEVEFGISYKNGPFNTFRLANVFFFCLIVFLLHISKRKQGNGIVIVGRGNKRSLKVYVHDTNLRSQSTKQLQENHWARCSRSPESFKTYV